MIRSATDVNASVSAPLPAGTVVDGRYVVEALLGEGTFGDVWRARDQRLMGRPVAVKFLKAEFLERPGAVARFEAEATALAQLSHPNIVGVLDRGCWQGLHYIVMELVEGRTLASWIDTHRRDEVAPDLATVFALFDQLCAALEAAHCLQTPGPIVHRDLKPDNVLLKVLPNGELGVKVLDFGIAQLGRRSRTHSGALLGTPLYMAPEQAMGQVASIGPWTDVFALAVIAVEMLTTRPQPTADEPWWGLALQRPGVLDATLAQLRRDVPKVVWDVFARALHPTPAERFANAGALRTALRGAAALSTGAGATPPIPQTAVRPLATTLPSEDLARAPTLASTSHGTPPPSTPGMPSRRVPEGGDLPWFKLLSAVALGAVFLGIALVALLVSLDGRARVSTSSPDGPPPPRPTSFPRLPVAPYDITAVHAFLTRWERARRNERGHDPLDRLYATSLRYHGSSRPPDFAQMEREIDRVASLGGTFRLDRSRTDITEESLDDDAVPSACRNVQGAQGPVLKVRAWVEEKNPDRTPDIGCPRLEGRYLLRLRATPSGLRICHETWSVDEGICASCPSAPLCQRRS
jgi:serine/threonine-protein kinase